MKITPEDIESFYGALSAHYSESGRHAMIWRIPEPDGSFDPYRIMVSEVMLQQTQVDRVAPKYAKFIATFPGTAELAAASLGEVLRLWTGLGYNRRAKFLWQAAARVEMAFGGRFPDTVDDLKTLPGVGPNTAGAIYAYAYNRPVVFVETNIRTVVIHHFFKDAANIADRDILRVLESVMQTGSGTDEHLNAHANPREFYWAMMDYGSYLKKSVGNLNRASKSYARQSPFEGSRRKVRGAVIRLLADGEQTLATVRREVQDERLDDVLDALLSEDMIVSENGVLRLA
jgi:A/G-specific adenine glycosylase